MALTTATMHKYSILLTSKTQFIQPLPGHKYLALISKAVC